MPTNESKGSWARFREVRTFDKFCVKEKLEHIVVQREQALVVGRVGNNLLQCSRI